MIGRILHVTPEEREEHFKSCEKKQDIVDSYKAKLKSIDCKHFDFGNGNCPFGSSCFYKHKVKPGSYTWRHHRPPPRRSGFVDDLFDMFNSIEELTASETALDHGRINILGDGSFIKGSDSGHI